MVDESRNATLLGCVDDSIVINTKQITASNATLEVTILANFGDLLSNLLSDILDDHVVLCNVLHSVQAPVVNSRASKLDGLLALLELIEFEHIRVLAEGLLLIVEVSDVATVGSAIRS